ncbi:MAG: TonB-dependent receptor [Alistipes sp.]|nr:TonB-dependent receptor [Alistipes sp.]
MLLSLFVVLSPAMAWAQNSVKGTVVDEAGEPVIGATVIVVGTQTGTTTDINGQFSLQNLKKESVLQISFIGYQTVTVPVNGVTNLKVELKNDAEKIDEVVVVGYGVQKKASVTAAISQISGEELEKAPVGDVTNMLAGRVAGVTAVQTSGQPGADGSSIMVRGQSVLYIVDGVPRDINQINPEDIESISILKDASAAAVYGLDGNTVIIVTTKRGQKGEATISYKGTFGVSANANPMELLDGPGYAYWYNKALELDGQQPIFTADIVQKMLNKEDGWGNTNWYDKVFDVGTTMSHTISANGGNDNMNYFASVGMFDQKGNVDNFNFRRYTARANLSAKIAKNLTLEVGVAGRIQDHDQPTYSADPNAWNNVAQQAMRVHPYVPEKVMVDGVEYHTATPTASATVNPVAAYEESGSFKSRATFIQPNISLRWDVPWVEGLSAKFFASYDMTFQHTKALSTPYELALGQFSYDENGYINSINYSVSNTYSGLGSENSLQEASYYTYYGITQTSLSYDNTFGKHRVAALALIETRDNKTNNHYGRMYDLMFENLPELNFGDASSDKRAIGGMSNRSRQVGFVARLNYDFDNRLYIELSGRYDGTYLFSGMSGSRWGFFPAASAGWRISEEKWFGAEWVDNLKLRGGIGLTGTSAVSAYQYLNTMDLSSGNAVVIGGMGQQSIYTSSVANPNISWEKNLNYNIGVDATFWGGKLGVEFDAFYTYKYDMLASASGAYPPSVGGYFPAWENKNKQDVKGFDITLSHNNRVGDFSYGIKFMGSYAKRRWLLYSGDAANAPDYQKLTGKEVGSVIGFIDQGLFQSEEEILNSPTMVGKPIRVGDIKYLDRNGDGKISYEQDRGYVGTSVYPKFTGGLAFNAAWKGIDLNFLLQGALGSTIALTGVYDGGIMDNTSMTKPFYHDGNSPLYLVENSWTPENTGAYFPRLSLASSSNNAYSSTRWYRPGDYLRLKTAQLGYTLPERLTRKVGIRKLRIYVEGSNLLTFSHVGKYNIDPELPSVNNGYYPQQRVMSVGLNITL